MNQHFIKQTNSNQEYLNIINLLIKSKIERYTSLLDDFDIYDAAKKSYHIVSIAYIGLTNFSTRCQTVYNKSESNYIKCSKICFIHFY